MRQETFTLFFLAVTLLLLIWRVRRGYACGMMREIANILSGAAALLCAALILFAVSSARGKKTHVFLASIAVLLCLGLVFKIASLIFRPLFAFEKISFVNGVNKWLGAALGAAEALALSYLLTKALPYLGVHII